MINWRGVIGSAATLLMLGTASADPARPIDPANAILEAFKTHDVVALGEGSHGNEQGAAFRMKLYRDPRFRAVVRDIVVESGNGRHQAMMDRYLLDLAAVPEKELRLAWLETTQPNEVWDSAIYADMFHSIHDLNKTLPKEKRLRILLGDTPYDPKIAGAGMRRSDQFPANLIQTEVLAKKRKALIVYGDMHFPRRPELDFAAPGVFGEPSIVDRLEKAGIKVFSIWTVVRGDALVALQADVAKWPQPSLTLLRGTPLGQAPFTAYYPKGSGTFTRSGPDGKMVTQDVGESIGGIMQDRFDALLYLGPSVAITYSKTPKALCADPAYVNMRAARLAAMRSFGGLSPADEFRAWCKEIAKGR